MKNKNVRYKLTITIVNKQADYQIEQKNEKKSRERKGTFEK